MIATESTQLRIDTDIASQIPQIIEHFTNQENRITGLALCIIPGSACAVAGLTFVCTASIGVSVGAAFVVMLSGGGVTVYKLSELAPLKAQMLNTAREKERKVKELAAKKAHHAWKRKWKTGEENRIMNLIRAGEEKKDRAALEKDEGEVRVLAKKLQELGARAGWAGG